MTGKKLDFNAVLAFLLVACALVSTNVASARAAANTPFPPPGTPVALHFVFGEKDPDSQQYGYSDFCVDGVNHILCSADYASFVGRHAYFVSDRPDFEKGNFHYFRVEVDNGEVLQVRKHFDISEEPRIDLEKFVRSGYLVPIDKWNDMKRFKPEPLVPGSARKLLKKSYQLGDYSYIDNTGDRIYEVTRGWIADLIKDYSRSPRLADALCATYIKYDDIERIYSIQSDGLIGRAWDRKGNLQAELELRIEISNSVVLPFLHLTVRADEPLPLESFIIASGEERYSSSRVSIHVNKDYFGYEHNMTIPAGVEEIAIFRAISRNGQAKVRVETEDAKKDFVLDSTQIEGIQGVLNVLDLVRSGGG